MNTDRKRPDSAREAWLCPERLIWLLLILLLIERLLIFRQLGPWYNSGSDDINYMAGGIRFAQTGMICYGGDTPTALIMPGMPIVIGLVCRIVGEGEALWVSMRVLWCLLGVLTAWYAWRCAKLCSNGWGGLAAALGFAIPNMAWMNHVILTETPYILFSTMCLFYTLAMDRSEDRRWFVGYVGSILGALAFRSNALLLLALTGAFLLWRKRKSLGSLLRRAGILACAVLLLLVPWTLRNYLQFGLFLPLTYGAGQPKLQGTYQGEGFPLDEELDYETHVHQVMLRDYAEYYRDDPVPRENESAYAMHYDPAGEVRDLKFAQYLSMQADGVKADYRLREWWSRDPASLLKSYLIIKPRWLLNWAWAWEQVLHTPYPVLHRLSQINMLFCAFTVLLALVRKQGRAPVLFLSGMYVILVYLYASSFVTDRYASSLMNIRYILAGIGVALLVDTLGDFFRSQARRKKL